MAIIIGGVTFLLMVLSITYYASRVYLKPGRVYERLGEADRGETETRTSGTSSDSATPLVRLIQIVGEKVPVSPAEAGITARQLCAAGFRSENAVKVFAGSRILLTAALIILALAFRNTITPNPAIGWVVVFMAAVLGWYAPGFILDHLVSARRERLRLSLPDALDLMVVCVEAGHGLDQAFVKVGKELELTHKDICEEFSLVNLEMRAGKRRSEALHNLAERTGEPELKKLTAIMVQSDRFGTSIAESLRIHAEFMRIRRRQEAEERAGKIGVKLIFPIFFCILPSMFLVTAGPAVIQVAKYLLPALRSAGGN